VREPFKLAYHALLHELGHQFGALHVFRPASGGRYVMEAQPRGEPLEDAGGGDYTVPDASFHPGNAAIMRALSGRPFDRIEPDTARWSALARVYRTETARYTRSKITRSWELDGYAADEFYPDEMYYALAGWASLFGLADTAAAYVDSALHLTRIVDNTCSRNALWNRAALCDIVSRYGGNGFETVMALGRYRKACIWRDAGRQFEAQREIAAFGREGEGNAALKRLFDEFMSQ